MIVNRRAFIAGSAIVVGHALSPVSLATSGSGEKLFDYIVKTRDARIAGDTEAWFANGLKTLTFAPEHADLMISTARAAAATGRYDEAARLFAAAARRGAGFEMRQFSELKSMPIVGDLIAIEHAARINLSPVAAGTEWASLPAEQCEGIAHDRASNRLFVGSSNGQIFAVDPSRTVSTFASGLQQVLGIKVDAQRRRLWAIDGQFPNLLPPPGGAAPASDVGFSGVNLFDVDSGRQLGRWELDERPKLHGLNDLAIATNGTIFLTDSPTGAIYRLATPQAQLEQFYQSDQLSFLNGLVITADDRFLYLAHTEGLTRLDLRRRTAQRVSVPDNVCVNGIDGLALAGRRLFGVQGSPYFARLLAMTLDSSGTRIVATQTLNARTPAEYQQTTCAIGRDAIFVVGGSPAVSPYGQTPATAKPRPHILRVPFT
jgi:sugar lactone lactonase YvrE